MAAVTVFTSVRGMSLGTVAIRFRSGATAWSGPPRSLRLRWSTWSRAARFEQTLGVHTVHTEFLALRPESTEAVRCASAVGECPRLDAHHDATDARPADLHEPGCGEHASRADVKLSRQSVQRRHEPSRARRAGWRTRRPGVRVRPRCLAFACLANAAASASDAPASSASARAGAAGRAGQRARRRRRRAPPRRLPRARRGARYVATAATLRAARRG